MKPTARRSASISPKEQVRVAVCIDSRDRSGRERLLGVYGYALRRGWQLHLVRTEDASTLRYLRRIEADGAILYDRQASLHRALKRRGIVCVEASDRHLPLDDAAVFVDNREVAALAGLHFAGSGYAHLAYCGLKGKVPSVARRDAFAAHAQAAGRLVLAFADEWGEGEAELRPLVDWLRRLPKPVGILTFDDKMAERVLAACRWAELGVPEDIGVLGIGGDELLCELTLPRLSSITLALQEIGRQAAMRLEALLQGNVPEARRRIPVPPREVVMRGSTERLGAVSAPVLHAVRFIRVMTHRSIGTNEVAAAAGVPRRTLERYFERELRTTVHDFLVNERVARARVLLKQSWAPMAELAHGCGYSAVSAFVAMYRKHTGEHPETYRKRMRA